MIVGNVLLEVMIGVLLVIEVDSLSVNEDFGYVGDVEVVIGYDDLFIGVVDMFVDIEVFEGEDGSYICDVGLVFDVVCREVGDDFVDLMGVFVDDDGKSFVIG